MIVLTKVFDHSFLPISVSTSSDGEADLLADLSMDLLASFMSRGCHFLLTVSSHWYLFCIFFNF